ncbi:MAG TPA: fumarylacetoacetate hydrolase family protein [Burkholderiaceae bacterium]|nr:fumarylacetoacetate hydrolase family protein [Burkholderiaceae bacterium]
MKLMTYRLASHTEIGALALSERVVRLDAAHRALRGTAQAHFVDMLAFLRGNGEARELAATLVDEVERRGVDEAMTTLADITLLAPVPVPESIREFMHAVASAPAMEGATLDPVFEQHAVACTRKFGMGPWRRSLHDAWCELPIYRKGNRSLVVGHGRDVMMPRDTNVFDYELEFGVFLSRGGCNIAAERVSEHIGGYVVFNDFSARDIHGRELLCCLEPATSDDFNAGNAMGPVLVTPDELPDPYALAMTARVNGREDRRGTSADMRFRFEDVIAYVSHYETLHPGEFFGSGTCSSAPGVPRGVEHGRFLREGDVVELEVERLGVLRNRVVKALVA